MLMEINIDAYASRDLLCEICTDPCAALIFARMLQEEPIVGRPGYSAPTVRVKFACYGTMGMISFENDEIITRR